MKKSLHPAVIAATLAVIVGVLGFFVYRGSTSGPTVEGVESMPPEVRAAYTQQGNRPAPPAQTP